MNTGYLQTIEINLTVEHEEREKKCIVKISLNETHTMSGEQEMDNVPTHPSVLYFGQMPKLKDTKDDIINQGFHGCMQYFQVGTSNPGPGQAKSPNFATIFF